MELNVIARERPPFVYWTCLWLVGLSFAIVLVFLDTFSRDPGAPPGRDFANLYTAGKLALEGRAWEAFDINIFRFGLNDVFGKFIQQNYSYPPHAMLLALPFALLPYWVAFSAWTALSAGLFYKAARPHMPFAPVLAVLTPAAALNMWNGHYGLILGALWLFFFANRGAKAGWIASLMTIKPHMGLFIGLAALRDWRTVVAGIAGTFVLVVLSIALFEPASWYGFIGNTLMDQTEILTRRSSEFYFRLMPSAYTAFGRGTPAMVLQLIFAIAALALLVRSRRIDPFALATATFLVVPYVFVYDMTVVCLGLAIIIWRDWGTLSYARKAILTLAFLIPNITLGLPALAPPILLMALWIQTKESGS
jgi:hypothetical protein